MAIIALENIRKSYADGSQMHHVLNQLNLSVEPNEFVAILGPSDLVNPLSKPSLACFVSG